VSPEEAKIYLPVLEGDDLVDVYEEKLFEYQQFFASKMPINKLFISRLQRLEKLHEAFETLGGKTTSSNFESLVWRISEGTIREVFNQYHHIRGEANVHLLSARSAKDIATLSMKVLEFTQHYAQIWCVFEDNVDLEDIKVTQEPDPMDLLKAIKDLEARDVKSFNQLPGLEEENLVLREAKRLTLWSKMYNDV